MVENEKQYDMLVDYVTGRTIPNVGTEEVRQGLEKYLVKEKGFQKEDIFVDADIQIDIDGDLYVHLINHYNASEIKVCASTPARYAFCPFFQLSVG